MFEITSSTGNLFRFYRTPTAMTSKRLAPQIRTINENPYLLVPTDSSFQIYSLQNLSLHFLGPRVPRISCIHYGAHSVVLCEKDAIHFVDRGEIVSTHPVPGGDVCEILKLGDYLIARVGPHDLTVYTCAEDGPGPVEEEYKINRKDGISRIYHPHTYTNKILIIYGSGKMELFNLHTQKTIFNFDFRVGITAVCQTSVLDVLGFGLGDGTVRIFNLKKNQVVFDILDYRAKEGAVQITHLDFKDRHCLSIVGGNLKIYDLELKKETFSRRNVFSGLFVNRDLFLVTTADSIEICNVSDFTVLKKRSVPSGPISKIEMWGGKEILFFGEDRLFKMNVYSDEQSCFLKNSGAIEKGCVHDNIVLYGDRRIRYLNREGAGFPFVDRRCDWIKTYKDFCFFGTGDTSFVMNLKSKRVILEHREPGIVDGDLNNEKFAILTESGVKSFNYKKEEVFDYRFADGTRYGSVRIVGNLYFLKGDGDLGIVCNATCRRFKADGYALDPTNKFLAVVRGHRFMLYDVLSGNMIEQLSGSVGFRDVVVVDGLKFVGLLDTENNLHLLSNHSFFTRANSTYLAQRRVDRPQAAAVAKKESNLSKEMACYKEFGTDPDALIRSLSKADILAFFKVIENNMAEDFHAAQAVLEKILRYKSYLVGPGEIEAISRRVRERWAEYEDKMVKCIGYLELSKNNML